MRRSTFAARPPRFAEPVELEAHVRALPHGAAAKGLFLRDPIERVAAARPGLDLFARAGVTRRRVLPFFDYPYGELMRVLVAASEVLYPAVPPGEGLRRLGHAAYGALLSQHIGKVLFATLGSDFARVAAIGARGWQISVNFGEVTFERLGEGHAAYHFRAFPAFLETYQVGVVEGAMRTCGVEGEVWAGLRSLGEGTLELWWR